MKTQLRNRSLRNLVVSVIVAAALNTAISAQPNPDRRISDFERLDIFMDQTEQSLKYNAPDVTAKTSEQEEALQNLELFSIAAEKMLKYKAPVELEDQIDQELELLANELMEKLEYHASVYDEFTNTFAENPVMQAIMPTTRPLVSEECTPQEAWLINAGYYKASRKSIIQKTRPEDFKNDKYADEL
jgi:hypothetical protein